MQLHPETVKSTGTKTITSKKTGTFSWETFSVEVTIGNDRRAVPCRVTHRDGQLDHINAYGIAVRFSSGQKVWPGSVTWWAKSGQVNNVRPNIDKRGYFFVAGYIEDFEGKQVKSQHNAVA